MFVANHTSMTDIMLKFYATKNPFVLVGKKELAKIPLFGYIYKRTCILVDRGNNKSRVEAFRRDDMRLNDGAFRLSIEHKITIAPMTFHDNKKRFPYSFFKGGPGKMRVKVHELIPTATLTLDKRKELKKKTRDVILEELQNPTV